MDVTQNIHTVDIVQYQLQMFHCRFERNACTCFIEGGNSESDVQINFIYWLMNPHQKCLQAKVQIRNNPKREKKN